MIFKDKRSWTVIFAAIVVMLVTSVVFAANRDFNKAETIRIGSLGPVQLVPGIGIHNAARMAIEEINAAGGIHGKKIELFIGDTEGKPEKGITALKKLVLEDKVDVLVGCFSSGVALALQPYLPRYKIVHIATGTASITLTNNVKKNYKKYKYFFRNMINSDIRQQKWAAKFVKEFVNGKLGFTKIAILAENTKWVQNYAPNLRKDLEDAGLKVVFYEMFDIDIKDFSPTFVKIKSAGAQWIAQIVSHAASIPLTKAWYDTKPAPMGLCNVAAMDSKFWEMTGGKCLGEITYNFIARAPLTDKTIPMWDKYVKKFGTNPVYTTGFTYDTIYMLTEVIKQKKSLKSEDIISGLENISYKGVLHPQIGFDKKTHDLLEGRYVMPMVQWQEGGRQVVIWPDQFKTGDYVVPF
ncbi:MAG: ABC transporter substrate-binding protein [Deltaproteobacteria bacterium]|nr:ABC transporter substrate-binding protein [Deltaproteobacteria bacterium]MBW2150462.1 ABC transporter substrate-binding protein [Deltaproteobacteria bacterium]